MRAIVSYIFGITAFTIAVQNADLAVVSLISAMPILGLLAWIMFREKVSPVSIPFILISALGVFFLTGVDLSGFHLGIGEIAAIVSAVGFNVGFLMSRLHAKQRSNYDNTTILLLIGWIPVCLLSVLATESIIPQHISLAAVIGLLFASAFNVFGLYAANYIFNNLKAYVAGNILLLEGVWAAVIGLVLYAESLTVHVVVGGLLILLSALTINRIDNKNEETLSV